MSNIILLGHVIIRHLALTILISLSFVTFADDFNDEEEVQSFGYKRFGKCIAVPDESAVSSRSIENALHCFLHSSPYISFDMFLVFER